MPSSDPVQILRALNAVQSLSELQVPMMRFRLLYLRQVLMWVVAMIREGTGRFLWLQDGELSLAVIQTDLRWDVLAGLQFYAPLGELQ